MNWLDDYRSKLSSPAEAVQLVKSGDRVYYGGNAAIPQALVRALAERREELVDAVYLQNRGIGRPMKAGKEAIFGAMAALEYRQRQDLAAWTAEQDRKVQLILDQLSGVAGLTLQVDADPNGCPFSRG